MSFFDKALASQAPGIMYDTDNFFFANSSELRFFLASIIFDTILSVCNQRVASCLVDVDTESIPTYNFVTFNVVMYSNEKSTQNKSKKT